MKRILLPILAITLLTNVHAQNSFRKEERNKAVKHLKSTQSDLMKSVKGLSEEQLNYKATDDSWSIAECVEHIALSENSLWGIVEMSLQSEPDPSMRSEVKLSDDEVIGIIQSREQKIKTQTELEPANKFVDYAGSLDFFNPITVYEIVKIISYFN